MANLNKVLLIGNLTRDPELRTLPSGMAVCNFGMAINRNFTDREGNRREETTFVDVECFGKQAETISQYMNKGRGIFVEGRLKLDQWETPAGEKRSKLRVSLENFQFVGGRAEGEESTNSENRFAATPKDSPVLQVDEDSKVPASTSENDVASKAGLEEDDVPF